MDGINKDLKNGPVVERSCTDVLCLIIFVLFTIGMILVTLFALQFGVPSRLTQPYDPDHRACGIDEGVKDFPYIYFVNPTSPTYLYMTTCVKSCPTSDEGKLPPQQQQSSATSIIFEQSKSKQLISREHQNTPSLDCAVNSVVKSCQSSYSATSPSTSVLIYDTVQYKNVICLPTRKDFFQTSLSSTSLPNFDQSINDIKNSKTVILASLAVAILVSFLFIFFLEKCTGFVVWFFILLLFSILATMSVLSFIHYKVLTNPQQLDALRAKIPLTQIVQETEINSSNPNTYLISAIIFTTLLVFEVLIVICFYQRIKLAIAILKTAGDFVEENKSILLLPLVTVIILLLYIVYWISISGYLYSCGSITTKPHSLPFGQFEFNQQIKIMGIYWFFGLIWNCAFIIASVEFIVCGAVCIWYFQQGPGGQKTFAPVGTSTSRFFSYHLGTVALGSFLLAVVVFIRFWLEYLYKNQEQLRQKSKIYSFILDCLRCCLWCFESCVAFINKNAYTYCQMTGKNFCNSAADAVGLIFRNPIRFLIVGGLGSVFVAVGRAFISLLTGFICYEIILNDENLKSKIVEPIIPSIFCALIGFVVGSNFMSVYGQSSDTILFVFCIDEEIKKLTKEPTNCPQGLQEFLQIN